MFHSDKRNAMTTLTLRVKDSLLDEVMALLGRFGQAEVEVVKEDAEFLAQKKYLNEQEKLFRRGAMKTYTVEEADAMLEKVIKEYEG